MLNWTKIGEPEIIGEGNGRKLTRQKFLNPKTLSTEDFTLISCDALTSIVFPLTPDRQVLVIHQFRHGINKVITEFPGGTNKTINELPEEIARRELLEETGYRAKTIISLSQEIWSEPSSLVVLFRPFLALDCEKQSDQALDIGEFLEVEKIPLPDWVKMVMDGNILDSKTIVTTFLALPYLGIEFNFRKRDLTAK